MTHESTVSALSPGRVLVACTCGWRVVVGDRRTGMQGAAQHVRGRE